MSESSWNHPDYTCSTSSSFDQVDSSTMFPTINSRQAHESYPSPASSIPSPCRTAHQDPVAAQGQHLTSTQDNSNADCYPSSYVESNVDDSRILSGRLSRLEYRSQRRRDSMQSPYPRTNSGLSPRHYPSTYETSVSRPQSPAGSRDDQYGINVTPPVPLMQNQSYRPITPSTLTPGSLINTYPSFDHQYSSHSQVSTTPHNYDHRPPSPALSTTSSHSDLGHQGTPEASRESPEPDVLTSPARPKAKKAKLTNALRKEICLYQQQHPNQKQEEIAHRFGVERSTVSKILKEKRTWLNIEDGIAEPPRHRPPKHPKLEEEMLLWLDELSEAGETITDAKIQKKALEIADVLRRKHGTISSEKGKDKDESFKASAGWIENFKRRHHVKGGVWHGRRKPEEPEIEDIPMTSQEPDIMHAIPDTQYIHHHPQSDHLTHPMEIEAHHGIVVEELPKGAPTREEAENAYHILTHYLDSHVQDLEGLGYKPEHRDTLHEIFKQIFFSGKGPNGGQ